MFLNQKLPSYLLGKYQLIGTVTFSVLFALVFLIIYIPFSDTAWFGLGGSVTFTQTLIFAGATILFLSISRSLMYRTKKHFDMLLWMYIAWCVLEILCVCILYSYITIDLSYPGEEDWWEVFKRAIVYGAIALGGPYLISGMYFDIIDKNKTIRVMN